MANERKFVYGSDKTLQSGGASVSNLQMSAAAGTTYSEADTLDYPDAVFILSPTFGASATSGSQVDLYIRALDIDGTTDAPAPSTGGSTASYKGEFIGSFYLYASTTGTYRCVGYDIPRAGEAYLYNQSGQTMSAWTLKMRPRTDAPS